MALPPLLTSVLGWLRAGYPEGVPRSDYLPLFALLASQLTNDDVEAVAQEFISTGDADSSRDIRDAIEMVTHSQPNDADVARVRAHLAAGGWPLARPDGVPSAD